jgi:ribosome-associated toxin RatA of RatAB toxin-antitoxin module
MAERTQRSIIIEAPSQRVMSVIADLESYPEWVSAAKSVEVLETESDGRARTARFVLDAGVVKDTYVLSYRWRPDDKAVSWTLVSGELQKAQDGTYELTGMFKRKAEKVITDTALKELKKRVEG